MCEHEGRALRALDNACDGERFAAARDTEQHLIFGAVVQAFNEGFDRRRLITLGLIIRMKFKAHVCEE